MATYYTFKNQNNYYTF